MAEAAARSAARTVGERRSPMNVATLPRAPPPTVVDLETPIDDGTCARYWFEEEYVVFLLDNGYLPSAASTIAPASTTEVPELVGKIDSLEQSLNKVKEMVGKNREGMGSCICLVCGCLNVTFLVLAILLVVIVMLK
ncbi:unnamed protein product [Miscanthus lutarioriparius]|uniref:Uncharacterized protein n=1 Tax=Miscanthus lutarioriparius TaxID=422564 RepID=A0A811NUU1_9POAL|nr:unnamed protein product [Miscanthus lutarioriparius]